MPECWIVDLAGAALEAHREPAAAPSALYGWRYRRITVLGSDATVAPLIAPAGVVAVADLLP